MNILFFFLIIFGLSVNWTSVDVEWGVRTAFGLITFGIVLYSMEVC